MQFMVLGYDWKGEQGLARRLAAREAHLAQAGKMQSAGNLLYGVAMLDAEGRMCGSMLVVEFNSREDLDRWLEHEPYVVGKVWERTDIIPCKVGPNFAGR